MKNIPKDYILSRHFKYKKEFIEVWTDGVNLIFVDGRIDDELGPYRQTISEPCKIANVDE